MKGERVDFEFFISFFMFLSVWYITSVRMFVFEVADFIIT